MRKVLCFQCSNWSTNPETCEHCGAILCRVLKEEIEEKERAKLHPPKPPNRLKRVMEFLKNSRNPLFKILYYIIMSIWFIYIGIMMTIMYIVSMVTG